MRPSTPASRPLSRLPRRRALAVLGAGLALGLAGCGETDGGGGPPAPTSTSPTSTPPTSTPLTTTSSTASPAASGPVRVTGVPEQGVEQGCLLIRPYLLVGGDDAARALLATGAKVTVTGHLDPDQMSFCQQGTILVVESAVRAG